MKSYIRVFIMVIAVLVGIRASGSFLLLADRSSDAAVLIGVFGLAATILFESLLFWALFLRNTKEIK